MKHFQITFLTKLEKKGFDLEPSDCFISKPLMEKNHHWRREQTETGDVFPMAC